MVPYWFRRIHIPLCRSNLHQGVILMSTGRTEASNCTHNIIKSQETEDSPSFSGINREPFRTGVPGNYATMSLHRLVIMFQATDTLFGARWVVYYSSLYLFLTVQVSIQVKSG